MKIYLLIHEQNTDATCRTEVFSYTDKAMASDVMRMAYDAIAYAYRHELLGDGDAECECECGEDNAVIRNGLNVESWRIEEQELDVRVAVRVKGGLVEEIHANAGVNVGVYDLDVSDFPGEGEQDEADKKEAELEELVKSPGWRAIW